MNYLGDFIVESTVRVFFNTFASDGSPITLAGSPTVAIYKNGDTAEATAGVTLTVDFDGRTGLHLITIDFLADFNFYVPPGDFTIVLTGGTVDGLPVSGYVIALFSIRNRSNLVDVEAWNGQGVNNLSNGMLQVELGGDALLLLQAK